MRVFTTLCSILFCCGLSAQNGLTTYAMPTGYMASDYTTKYALAIDNSGNKWVAFKTIGLGKFNGSTWTMYDMSNSLLPSNKVLSICIDASGTVWAGTDNGAASYNGSTWTVYNTANSGLADNYVGAVYQENNTMWFGTHAGASSLTGSLWATFTRSGSGLASDTVQCFASGSSGDFWLGTYKGLSKKNGNGFINYTTSNSGLASDNITALFEETNSRLWIGTFSGVSILSGTSIAPLAQAYPTAAPIYGTIVRAFCRGFSGGVLFCQGTQFIEIANGNISVYYPGHLPSNLGLPAFDAATSQLWFVNYIGTSANRDLFRFDASNYNGFGLGLTNDNVALLDANQVSAIVMNRGDMHWNTQSPHYEVPKGSGVNSVFVSSLWMGGLDNGGSLHQAAMTYRQTGMDYWPGPLDTLNAVTDSATANNYDSIWKVDRNEIAEFIYYFGTGAVQSGTYIPAHDITYWPAHGNGNYSRNLAPFVDVNANGIYDPLTGGDYPKIKGDQMLYWIFNDNLTAHTETGGLPLKVEVHASAYDFVCPTVADSDSVMNYTTFYNYKIYNRSAQRYDSTYLGIFQDSDLGAYSDDYVGCYPQGNYGFFYNGTANDGGSAIPQPGTYGAHPPMLSTVILNGPDAEPNDGIDNDNDGTVDEAGEKNLMTSFMYYDNDFLPVGNPEFADDFYNYMHSKWKDSTSATFGGNGYGGTVPTRFMYPGLPYDTATWTEPSAGNIPFDRRFVIGCGPFSLDAGEVVDLDYALVWTRDTNLAYNDPNFFRENLEQVNKVKGWFANNNTPSCMQWVLSAPETQQQAKSLSLYPNPGSALVTIEFDGDNKASFDVLDLTGRQVQAGKISNGGLTVINVEALPTGVYFVRVIDGSKVYCTKFVRR